MCYAVPQLARSWLDAAWSIETVAQSHRFSNMGPRSLAPGPGGNPNVAYGGKHLYYAWYDGIWHIDVVDPTDSVGEHTSLALSSQLWPRITYYDSANGDLKYAYFAGTAWQFTIVDDGDDMGADVSLALDGAGNSHLRYGDANEYLRYACRDRGGWKIDTAGGMSGEDGSLAFSRFRQPCIAYYYQADLYYACREMVYTAYLPIVSLH